MTAPEEDASDKREAPDNTSFARPSVRNAVSRSCLSLTRAGIRYCPMPAVRRLLWDYVVEPYFRDRSNEFIARTFFGGIIIGDSKDLIESYLYYFGIWEPHLTHWIETSLKPGDTFIDVGANIGYYSLLASNLVGDSGCVVAIEASAPLFGRLGRNLSRNRASNVRAINFAVSDVRGVVSVYAAHDYNRGKTSILPLEDFPLEGSVDCAPLPELLRPAEIEHARIIKIDVEGAEYAVVSGLRAMLEATQHDLEIVVEISPQRLAEIGKDARDIIGYFVDAGFYPYTLENDYSPSSYLKRYAVSRPRRLRTDLLYMTDVIFSRRDVVTL